ncbi:MAG: DUF1553 domain-containing protein, partial [Planctomycetales bacterium]|nr:DUF1553 domain-containing protein [Planctomycetales bacterium]
RNATNVPAQSLMLLNDPTIHRWAQAWGGRVNGMVDASDAERIERMFLTAFARGASEHEIAACLELLDEFRTIRERSQADITQQAALLEELNQQLLAIERPYREQLEGTRTTNPVVAPTPLHEWNFRDTDPNEESDLALTLSGDARRGTDGLELSGNGWAASETIPVALEARSMEAWVRLATLDQQGGGVMSLETPDGITFDAIVYGEQEPRRWLAGSNFFDRTLSFQGDDESEATERFVHLVWTYAADGTIRAYRDGELHGHGIRKSPLVSHAAGTTRVLLGLRHSPAGGNRLLRGTILSAALFDHDLSAEEVSRRQQLGPSHVTRSQLLAAMSPADREQWQLLSKRQDEAEARLSELRSAAGGTIDPADDWAQLALTLLNLKELMYVD